MKTSRNESKRAKTSEYDPKMTRNDQGTHPDFFERAPESTALNFWPMEYDKNYKISDR